MSKLRGIKPLITGQDLINLGLKPGPIFHQILDEVLEARLDGKVETKEDELELVRRRLPIIHGTEQQKIDNGQRTAN